jgi:hypothetical protein
MAIADVGGGARRQSQRAGETRHAGLRYAGLIVFVAIPLAIGAMYWPSAEQPDERGLLLRPIFVLAAVMLPAFLFFLHAMTRRESAFNAFVTALDRLGLLHRLAMRSDPPPADTADPQHPRPARYQVESEACRKARVIGYLDRFAAAYGAPSSKVVDELLSAARPNATRWPIDEVMRGSRFQLRTILSPLAATLLILVGWRLALPPGLPPAPADDPGAQWWALVLRPNINPVTASFLGAYFYSVEMLRRRYTLRDININAYNDVITRMILAVIGVAVLTAHFGAKDDGSWWNALAFLVGFFPMIVVSLTTTWVQQKFDILRMSRAEMPLRIMDGIDIWHEGRLAEEDITDVQNLAAANLVALIVNTRYSADRLIDWVDQAVLYTTLGPQPEDAGLSGADPAKGKEGEAGKSDAGGLRTLLRGYGIRTATALVDILDDESADGFLASLPEDRKGPVRALGRAVQSHPNFPLLYNWRIKLTPIEREG